MSVDPKLQHKPRPLQLNPQGKHIAKANELRQRLKEEELERQRIEDIRLKGLLPDENLAEHLYKPQYPPIVEWWDRPYLSEMKYGSELKLDSEEAPVSIYIQHPVLIPPPWESHLSEEKAMYLTKKEMKRIRRNDRQQKHKDQQDRIKLGLDAPPPPKVKLSNLMNVLTNEAIKDPTGVEMKVKQEVEERYQKHMQENEERKLTKDEKHDKIKRQHEQDLQKGYFTTVYKVQTLQDPQHFFKVDMNAKQLDFVGVILLNPRFNLIIVEGGLKNINFYKKLMTRRIKWTQGGQLEDLSQNQCDVLWEGQLKQLHFKKWSVMHSSNDDEAYMVLNKFGCENYWREAVA
ncbi:Pre-mRNA-splicing factor 3 [Hyphopichia burtonii NRRL Y-1933]|uniref:Pre-mRNA-splicing factor 3 n=1 Tax=Hyphopichia burtonii NRRL Y-1933 TaxID=984485 RepID=A0A1E4RMI6_9ASCO|nr:Pre-mRNA-splicing factor 3 [Hyphopichia burtonii NRRL Y-1933]ODV68401.1 Pre-mRNA-splicing factor 3 [Hyphopichia burtonii NRRL Y-1933]